jgi:hypothetical protein
VYRGPTREARDSADQVVHGLGLVSSVEEETEARPPSVPACLDIVSANAVGVRDVFR